MSGAQYLTCPTADWIDTPRTSAVTLDCAEVGEVAKVATTPVRATLEVTCSAGSPAVKRASTPTTSVGSEPHAPEPHVSVPQPSNIGYASRTVAVEAVGGGNTTVNVPALTVTSVPKSSTAMAALVAVAL